MRPGDALPARIDYCSLFEANALAEIVDSHFFGESWSRIHRDPRARAILQRRKRPEAMHA